jgi:hypothetical protein
LREQIKKKTTNSLREGRANVVRHFETHDEDALGELPGPVPQGMLPYVLIDGAFRGVPVRGIVLVGRLALRHSTRRERERERSEREVREK